MANEPKKTDETPEEPADEIPDYTHLPPGGDPNDRASRFCGTDEDVIVDGEQMGKKKPDQA